MEGSLKRLSIDSVDILLLHDPDIAERRFGRGYHETTTEAYPALAELRSQGVVKAIGAGMNHWEMELRLAQEGDFDCFLLACRYTLWSKLR